MFSDMQGLKNDLPNPFSWKATKRCFTKTQYKQERGRNRSMESKDPTWISWWRKPQENAEGEWPHSLSLIILPTDFLGGPWKLKDSKAKAMSQNLLYPDSTQSIFWNFIWQWPYCLFLAQMGLSLFLGFSKQYSVLFRSTLFIVKLQRKAKKTN